MFPFVVDLTTLGVPVQIPTAGLFGLLGILAGGLVFFALQKRRENFSRLFVLLAVLVGAGVLGGRIGQFVINLFLMPGTHPLRVFYFSGSTITAGMIGCGIALAVFRLFDRQKTMDENTLAALAIAFCFGKVFLRVGCMFAGCCYGVLCEPGLFAVTYPENWIMPGLVGEELSHGPRIPAPLVSAGALLVIGVVLLVMYLRLRRADSPAETGKGTNRLAGLFLVLYGIYRFSQEFLRDDPFRLFLGPFSTGQWFGLLCIPTGVILWYVFRREVLHE